MENKVFLGGTCAESTWRNDLIPLLRVNYFNPVVDNWTSECQKIEKEEKNDKCNIHLYVITSEMQGFFSIAEIIDSLHEESKFTIANFYTKGFTEKQKYSIKAILQMIADHGGWGLSDFSLIDLAGLINEWGRPQSQETK
jgi:hypothetical protein